MPVFEKSELPSPKEREDKNNVFEFDFYLPR